MDPSPTTPERRLPRADHLMRSSLGSIIDRIFPHAIAYMKQSKPTTTTTAASGSGPGPSSNWAALQKQITKGPATGNKPSDRERQRSRFAPKPKSTNSASSSSTINTSSSGSINSRSLVPAASILRSMAPSTPTTTGRPGNPAPYDPSAVPRHPGSISIFKTHPLPHRVGGPPSSTSTSNKPYTSSAGFSPSTALGVQLLPLPIPASKGSFASNMQGISNGAQKEMLRKGLNPTGDVALMDGGKQGKASTAAKGKGREVISVERLRTAEGSASGDMIPPGSSTLEAEEDDGLLLTTLTTSTSDPSPLPLNGEASSSTSTVPKAPIHPTRKGLAVEPISEKDMPLLNELRIMVAGKAEDGLSEGKRAAGNYLAIDCEMVGTGPLGSQSVLARVSIVNFHGAIILDAFVRPKERVTDWRTWVSGIRESDMRGARGFEEVQKQVAGLVEGKVLIGHAFENDTKALLLSHPAPLTRDTQTFHALREVAHNKRPGLKKLSELELGVKIQAGAHSSVTDARATMALYRIHKNEWEQAMRHQTDAYYTTTKQVRPGASVAAAGGEKKRKAGEDAEEEDSGDDEDAEVKLSSRERKKRRYLDGKKEHSTSTGKTGISSGLSVVTTRPGGKEVAKARGPGKEEPAEAGNWWEA